MSGQEFNKMVLNNTEGLKPFAVTLTKDKELAKDLYQETLYKAFLYRKQYQPGTNIRAWLYTIMRNIFINDYRRKLRRRVVMQAIGVMQPALVPSSEMRMSLKEIEAVIHKLPFIFKSACLLYLQGYKYHEIAFVLNEPLGTIKSRIHFARKIVQKQVER